MAASIIGIMNPNLHKIVKESQVFVVGAGGIGCEILKNLVLSGFENVVIIDLDTIDVSNLNRQFLFHREHVGKSKALVAKESALQFNPEVNITAYHDSIFSTKFGVNFYKKFNIVLNALDNRAARNHVNRMCLNAEVPLIESGTAGYNGQVELISKGLTQCYECTPKPTQKSFPGCTIRNTPSEPIHCIVWAKHLFNQLFGESIDDEDISPDKADPEASADGEENLSVTMNGNGNGNVVRINTREWAKNLNYDPEHLFNKFFCDDINYLLSMSNLWKTRKAPKPLTFDKESLENSSQCDGAKYHKVWSLDECMVVFANCLKSISTKFLLLNDKDTLVWDKDDQSAMDFVAACANIRGYVFDIERKSRFEIKSMAGNIIPAVATTNAITAGVVVMHTFKVLQDQKKKCTNVYMRPRQNPRQQLIVPEKFLVPPNPNCYVCSADPAIRIKLDTNTMSIKDFRDEILIKALNMVNPDVGIDAKGIVIISSEEGETECNEKKLLKDMDIVDGVILQCDDFFQDYRLSIIIEHCEAGHDMPLFEVIAGENALQPKDEENKKNDDLENKNASDKENSEEDDLSDEPHSSKKRRIDIEDSDDDLCVIEDDESTEELKSVPSVTKKSAKKRKPSNEIEEITEISDSDEEGPSQIKRSRREEQLIEFGGDISSD